MLFEKQKGSPRGEAGMPAIPTESGRQSQAGQILLIVILIIIIASTIGLSVVSRSITSLRTSIEEAESQKALAAAEAGIERAIQGIAPPAFLSANLSNNSSYATQFAPVDNTTFLINGGNIIPKDEGADVWFVGHDSNNVPIYTQAAGSVQFFNLYWGSPSEDCASDPPAAIEAIAVSKNKNTGETKSYRYVYDSCSDRRTGGNGNNFTSADSGNFTLAGVSFGNRTPQSDLIKNVENIIFVRVIPIYKDAVIGVLACNYDGNNCTPLPSQGYVITSTGISGQAHRKLKVFKGYPQSYLPYLSYGLFVAN